jgi:hypothetical protein
MMKAARIAIALVAAAMLYGGHVQAQSDPVQVREPRPGAATLAALGSVLYAPVRISLAAVGSVLGGLTGWLTAGNEQAAQDIWQLPPFDGQMFLQPDMMYGAEPVEWGQYSFRMHITPE